MGEEGLDMRSRSGIALVNVLLFATITTIMLVAGIQFTQASLKEGSGSTNEQMAYQVALGGITHAVAWLQTHRSEAPSTFDPRSVPLDPEYTADTTAADEPLGIVHEYEIDASKNLWGRYEVGRSSNAPQRDSLPTTGPDSALHSPTPITWTVDNVGLARGGSSGTIWRARSRGYLFTRTSTSQPFTVTSPAPVRSMTLEGEVRNVAIRVPRAALYCFRDGASGSPPHVALTYAGSATAGNTALSTGGSNGVQHLWTHTASANVTIPANVDWGGLPVQRMGCSDSTSTYYVNPDLSTQIRNVFGTSTGEGVEGIADASYSAPASFPATLPGMGFFYMNPGGNRGLAVFNAAKPLRGSGILFVDGSVWLDGATASHDWQGLIFVTGVYKQTGASTVTGAVVAGGGVSEFGGSDGKKAVITYSQDVLDRVSAKFAGFRLDRSTLKVVDNSATTY